MVIDYRWIFITAFGVYNQIKVLIEELQAFKFFDFPLLYFDLIWFKFSVADGNVSAQYANIRLRLQTNPIFWNCQKLLGRSF